ncbi:alpha/beta hydrolase family protein [Desulforhopalus sp. 52FAK]
MIEPFFFDNNRLFGCYHPSNNIDSRRLLVICPPLFDEYRRAYRALSQLAIACSTNGIHVLRFDYYGTAESKGLIQQASITEWIMNINEAIIEGIALSGASEVILLGIRFGATLAAQSDNPLIKRYIFWDPILSGKEYLSWLAEVNQDLKKKHRKNSERNNLPFEEIEYVNETLSSTFKEQIAAVTIGHEMLSNADTTSLITTNPKALSPDDFINCEFPGIVYEWPYYHDGVITQKPVLETIAKQVLKP